MSQLDKLNETQKNSLFELIVNLEHQKWAKSWAVHGYGQQNTKNTAYNGGNQLTLFRRAVESEFKDPRWITFNEANKNHTPIKKGSKGEFIGFFTNTASVLKKDDNGQPILDKDGKKQYEIVTLDKPVLKTYYVFNAQDVDGIEAFKLPDPPKITDPEKFANIEKLISNYCADNDVKFKEISSQSAFYQSNQNEIKDVVIPLKEQFQSLDEYYAVAFHELTHSTKCCIERTNKETDNIHGGNVFGSKNYAKEELVAELGSLFMCQRFSLSGFADNKDCNTLKSLGYLKNWLEEGKLTKDDLGNAIKDANRAVSKLLSYMEKTNEKSVNGAKKEVVKLEVKNIIPKDRDEEIQNVVLKNTKGEVVLSDFHNKKLNDKEIIESISKFLKDNNYQLENQKQANKSQSKEESKIKTKPQKKTVSLDM